MQSNVTHENAQTQYLETNGHKYAYRRLGPDHGVPLLFCHRFRGTMDDWDPQVINGFAEERPVILFDNAGVGNSSGLVPPSINDMAAHAVAVIRGLKLDQVDLLGFSMGGYVSQMVTLDYPQLVRRVILAGTGPGGGEGIVPGGPDVRPVSGRAVLGLEEFQFLFFTNSKESLQASREYWERLKLREGPIEPPVSPEGIQAQVAALTAWAQGNGNAYPRLGEIKQPVLVANGHNDVMVPTPNSFLMSQRLPNATLIVYPDSGHGFLFQYPQQFVSHSLQFLR